MITDRIELAKHFAKLGFTKGVEIGVADGRYAEILCESIPNLSYWGVDVWAEYEGNWRDNKYQDGAYLQAQMRLKQYPKAELYKMTSLRASLEFGDNSMDFVFIDGAHDFDNVMLDILLWTPKIKSGGIVSGHDYYQLSAGGIIPAVNAYVQAHKIDINFTLRGVAEHKDDQVPCWWFIKK